jgi:hypothetical protein
MNVYVGLYVLTHTIVCIYMYACKCVSECVFTLTRLLTSFFSSRHSTCQQCKLAKTFAKQRIPHRERIKQSRRAGKRKAIYPLDTRTFGNYTSWLLVLQATSVVVEVVVDAVVEVVVDAVVEVVVVVVVVVVAVEVIDVLVRHVVPSFASSCLAFLLLYDLFHPSHSHTHIILMYGLAPSSIYQLPPTTAVFFHSR